MIRLQIPIIVEGKYDKARLARIVDAAIITTEGFGIFNNREKAALIRQLARDGVILLCDSDGGGQVIRGYLKGIIPPEKVYDLYVPQVAGKEKRKRHGSKAGFLGVEGLDDGVLTALLVCRLRRVKILPLLDAMVTGLLVGQAIGRWGNFINMEAFGGNTTLPWGMTSNSIVWYLTNVSEELAAQGITVDPNLPVHPTFLYESLWNVAGFFLIIYLLMPRRKFDGQIFLFYLFWYGLGRAWVEGLRTDSLMWGPFRVSQLVAVVCVVVSLIAAAICLLRYKAGKTKPLYCTSEESALAVSGELYGKKSPKAEEEAEAAEDNTAPLTETKEEL